MTDPTPVKPITGKTVLTGMVAFFTVIVVVNGLFVYFALDSWPKLVSQRSYQDGLEYNATLDAAKAQNERGWTSVLRYDGAALQVQIFDKARAPLGGLAVEITARRPVNDGADVIVSLTENQTGQYIAALPLPLSGRWYVMIEASRAHEISYRMEYEIMVKL